MANIKSFPNNRDEYVGAEYAMRWLHGRTSGVFAASNNAAVAAVQNSMAVTVSDGIGWLSDANANGIVWWNDTEKTSGSKLQLTIAAADGTLSRIDRVIVEWTTTTYADLPQIKILKGTAASSPSVPALTNNTTKRQISLARIRIPAGTTAIAASMITDERQNPSVCGIVTESVKADTSVINAQFEALLAQLEKAIQDAGSGAIPDKSITLAKLASDVTATALGGQKATQDLTAVADVADADYFPFYDTSAGYNRKTLWSNIVAKIRAALFGTLSGFLKADGSGKISSVSAIPVANGGTSGTTAAAARANLGITPANIGALPISGGTITGQLQSNADVAYPFIATRAGEVGFRAQNTSGSQTASFLAAATRSGLYINGAWMIDNDGTTTRVDGMQYRHIYAGTSATTPSTWQPGDIYLQYQ